MTEMPFDEHAEEYDAWFLKNRNILQLEVLLLRHFLADPGKALSVGCGSGLFELLLRTEHGIEIRFGVEPAEAMAAQLPFAAEEFDTVLLNGTASYPEDLAPAVREAHRVLRRGGRVVVADVPAESSYGLLYQLAAMRKTWEDPSLGKIAPAHPYPVEFALAAHWRNTEEKAEALRGAGFVHLEYAQTLTRHPKYSDESVEQPVEGLDRGDYVAIRARKP